MTRHRLWLYPALAILIAAVAFWAFRGTPRPVEVAVVHRGPLVQYFDEEGRTELPHRWVVSAPVGGILRRIDLLQGDTVKSGQVIAMIEPARAALLDPANRARLQAEERAAQASAQSARQRLVAAQTDVELTSRELRRMRSLAASGMTSAAVLDETEARQRRALASAAAAKADLRASEQQHAALVALLNGQGQGGGQIVDVRAPIAGVVLRRYLQSTAAVQAGEPLLELGDLAQLQVMAQVLSQQAIALRPGSHARIIRWGGEGALPARIVRIEPGGFTKVSALGVEEQRTQVWLEITAPRGQWSRLGDGFRVEVQFDVARLPDVLQVASSALFRDGSRWAVYRVVKDHAVLTSVTTGAQGDDAVQITGGLHQGDEVIAFPDDRMANGLRVRAVNVLQ